MDIQNEPCLAPGNPFSVFPEEIWLLIFDQMEITSQTDLQSLLSAVPELSSHFRKRFTTLQFTQVSPLVFDYQPSVQYPQVSGGGVSKEWCVAVCEFLKQNPVEKSNHFSGGKYIKRIVPQFEFYYPMASANVDLQKPVKLATAGEIQEFHQTLQQNSTKTLDLPAVTFAMEYSNDWPEYHNSCLVLLFEFGTAFQNVTLEIPMRNAGYNQPRNLDAKTFFHQILTCLENLPNIQRLSVDIVAMTSYGLDKIIWECTQFPVMNHLRKLEILTTIQVIQNTLLHYFINGGYLRSGTFQKLLLRKKYYSHMLTSDVEYQFQTKCNAATVKDLDEFLSLQKRACVCVEPDPGFTILHLSDWLTTENHATENLVIKNMDFSRPRFVTQLALPFERVKYLKTCDSSNADFQFLRAFPMLEYLHIGSSLSSRKKFMREDESVEEQLSVVVRHYLYGSKVSKEYSIWKELPSLRSLVVEEEGVISKHFVREYKNKRVTFRSTIELIDIE